jgi:hypothetical protein
MMFASLADWTHEELVAAVNETTRLSAAATAKRLEAVAEQQIATNRMLEIDKEWRIRRQLLRARTDEQQLDHDEFIREQSLGGKR